MEIQCCTCKRWKDEECFALDSTHITGRGRACRVCHSEYARKHYQKNREKTLARVKARYAEDPSVHLTYVKKWRKSAEGRDSRYRETQEQRRKFPARYQAYLAVQRAVHNGELIQGPCSICGEQKTIHAHHDDYTKPLDVIWLCRKHHQERHKCVAEPSSAAPM